MAKFVGPEDGEEDDRVDDVLLPRKEVDQRLCRLDLTQDLNRKFLKYMYETRLHQSVVIVYMSRHSAYDDGHVMESEGANHQRQNDKQTDHISHGSERPEKDARFLSLFIFSVSLVISYLRWLYQLMSSSSSVKLNFFLGLVMK